MEAAVLYHRCADLVSDLYRFDSAMLQLGPSVTDDRLRLFEKSIGFYLPLDFEYLLTLHNGFSLMGTVIYGIDDKLGGSSLNQVYQFEHFGAGNPMPAHLLPFSADGQGNHYCLDLSKVTDGRCPVVFWQHDVAYRRADEAEICYPSFMEWMREVLINGTLAAYNYDGTEK